MARYINKDALVAEIKKLQNTYKKLPICNSYEEGLKDGRLIGYKDALYKINNIEVKDIDLEKECKNYIKNNFTSVEEPDEFLTAVMQLDDMVLFAKYFVELGINIQNN